MSVLKNWSILVMVLMVTVVCVPMTGCGEKGEFKRYHLEGTVTFQGLPLPYGEMILSPDVSKQNSGPSTVLEIHNGKFHTEPGQGHIGGPYTAIITGFDGKHPQVNDPLRDPKSLKGSVIVQHFQTSFDFPKANHQVSIEIPAGSKK